MRRSTTRVAAAGAALLVATGGGACGGGSAKTATTSSGANSAPAAGTARVRIVDFTFQPMTVTVRAGGTVTWMQVDRTGHSVQSDTGAWPTSAVLNPGQTFSHTFARPGTYGYICGVHTNMHGTVQVVG